jgi:hypothetical protein
VTALGRPLVPAALAGLAAVLLLVAVPAPPLAWLLMGVTAGYALSGSV